MDPTPHASLDAARHAAARDDLPTWIADFLRSPGSDNAALAATLCDPPRYWAGPVLLPIDRLHRLAGPPDQPTLDRFDEEDLDTVEEMNDSLDQGWEPPPALVSYRDDQLVVEDGNHRLESLRQAGHDQAWAVVGFETATDRDRFIAHLDESAVLDSR